VGEGAKMLMTRVLPEEVRTESLIEECRQDFETSYRECWDEQTVPYKNIPELLDTLYRRKLKLTVLSNKPHEFTLLAVNKLLPSWSFEMILGQRAGVPRKT
jgi:phosphoglycolate phosphatase